jgi:hypothetical protein
MLFTFNSRTKWLADAIKYRKEKLEELRVGLRDKCELSLQKISYELGIGALLEFGKAMNNVSSPSSFCVTYLYSLFLKTDLLCEQAEKAVADNLRQHLTQFVEEIWRNMPQLCIKLAGGGDNPITHLEVNTAREMSDVEFTSRRQLAFSSVRSTLASWFKQLNLLISTSSHSRPLKLPRLE